MDKRILCVDDDEGVREVLLRLARRWGYEIECASGVEDAMEMFEALNPFLVITDLRLGHIDGVTLADRLHRQYDPLCIFIALTGMLDSYDLSYLLTVFTDVFIKPVDMPTLKTTIDYAWKKRRRWESLLR